MHSRDVPVAIITATLSGTLKKTVKTNVKQGTKIIPPPTPNSPAKNPAMTPHKARIIIVSTSSNRGMPNIIFPPFFLKKISMAILQEY